MTATSTTGEETLLNFEKWLTDLSNQLFASDSSASLWTEPSVAFDLSSFWTVAVAAATGISKDAAALCILMTGDESDGCETLTASLGRSALSLASHTRHLNQTGPAISLAGSVLTETVNERVWEILNSLVVFARTLRSTTTSAQQARSVAGVVCSKCDAFLSAPRSCQQMTGSCLRNSLSLVSDAVDEVSADEDPTEYTGRVLGLVKCARSILTKLTRRVDATCSSATAAAAVDACDGLCERVNQVSPLVDDLVVAAAAAAVDDEGVDGIRRHAGELASKLSELLEFFEKSCFCVASEDSEWLGFLKNAVEHNVAKF